MNVVSRFRTTAMGLALFSMLFGAGNLIYPILVGRSGGQHFLFAISGFLLTGVIVPLLGLLTIILFDGDYRAFFYRVGIVPGKLLLFVSMFVIGPVIGMPRIITLSYEMLQPLLPAHSLAMFALAFLVLVFLLSFRQKRVIELLGLVIAPLLLISLGITVVLGLLVPGTSCVVSAAPMAIFWQNMRFGANTLDLLAIIFFGSVVIRLVREASKTASYKHVNELGAIAFRAGIVSCILLAAVYMGMGLLGLYHGCAQHVHAPELLFRSVAMAVIGAHGGIVVICAVLMACVSTAIGLAVVVTEYTQHEIFRNRFSYVVSLIGILIGTFLFSLLGLDRIITFTNEFASVLLVPIVLVVTFANLAYKLFGFRPIRIPVLMVTLYVVGVFLFGMARVYCQ